ncbi:psm1 [Symbiodinium necroappetens]|uniref:Psm1 protein n=1 Tax=Symbiodinium necroappetens TaxID=1628268 RepID=A0A812Y1M7_9DINO|nr:psm1 [Symbiodinium necroappetens]
MEIKGRVLYCNDKWQEQHIEKPQETKPRRTETCNTASGVCHRLTKATAAGFEGGAAFLDLEDLEDPWNGGVKFTAMPPAKRFCDIALLSGGEKTVAAMALLFAMQSFQRPPFLILDEVDAYLDHSNVQALASYIASVDCQAIVISHKHRFFSHGEGLVGVSRHRERNASVVFTMDLERIRRAGREQRAAPEVVPLQ